LAEKEGLGDSMKSNCNAPGWLNIGVSTALSFPA
jgi:hypothetical protein